MSSGSPCGEMTLTAVPLTAEAFIPYGNVIEVPAQGGRSANDATARRFDDVARLDLFASGGAPSVSIFRSRPALFPLRVRRMERHPLSTQMFVPLGGEPFLVVVAIEDDGGRIHSSMVRAFLTNGRQGINYGRGVWHHPLIALQRDCDFVMLGRRGGGVDCDLAELHEGEDLTVLLPDARSSSISR